MEGMRKLLNPAEHQTVFLNVTEIAKCSRAFLRDLEWRQRSGFVSRIGDILLKHVISPADRVTEADPQVQSVCVLLRKAAGTVASAGEEAHDKRQNIAVSQGIPSN